MGLEAQLRKFGFGMFIEGNTMKFWNKYKGDLVLAIVLFLFALIMSPIIHKPVWTIVPIIIGGIIGMHIFGSEKKRGKSK